MLAAAQDTINEQARRIAGQISRNPAVGIAACFGIGFIAGKLPLFRFITGSVRMALPLAPPLLAAVGAVRVWNLVSPRNSALSGYPAREEGEALNQLLAMELASLESYTRTAPRFDGEDRRVIEHLKAVHEDSVRHLKNAVQDAGVFPLLGNSPWESLVDQLAHVSGGRLVDSTLFSLMLAAEESSIRHFESALLESSLSQDHQTLIRRHLLPRAHENVNSLLRLRSQQAQQPQHATA
ncbi:hypothetical protein OKA04_02470 [Luteolibacter flavescens]|uniref:DUF2383 domain-containing protein n=1 Tax=Luteolibacter flavescens TaxID=1859460 RepID=A0ABT3FJN9_9BACT|nr:hypothetical protein [Luteolibacter flavescens]MCW1883574.1 hypothetical protein [Luteolibacter flavescens]